jgi:ubiquinone/menaquinone biosynthesis C-methylase UbiE
MIKEGTTGLPFPDYNIKPGKVFNRKFKIASFVLDEMDNVDHDVVNSFGEEWTKFNSFSSTEIDKIGKEYFDVLPSELLNKKSSVLDVGCGTGRWSLFLSPKVGFIDAVDPSKAIFSAEQLLKDCSNVRLTLASTSTLPFPDNYYNLVMSIGVLHHIPDTQKAMQDCVRKVKPGGWFYTYLYYNLDNRNKGYKFLFSLINKIRIIVSNLPSSRKKFICDILAISFYMPFVFASRFLHSIGLKKLASKLPLSYYRNKSFFIIRNDSLDRFGTKLEQRFSKKQIETMLLNCGLTEITFSNNTPYWHVIAKKTIES